VRAAPLAEEGLGSRAPPPALAPAAPPPAPPPAGGKSKGRGQPREEADAGAGDAVDCYGEEVARSLERQIAAAAAAAAGAAAVTM